MNITKEQWLSLIRHLLTILGAYLVAKQIVDKNTILIVLGSTMASVGTLWGIIDKTSGVDAVASLIRHLAAIAGAFGWVLSPETVEQIVSVGLAVGSIFLGQKNQADTAKVIELQSKVVQFQAMAAAAKPQKIAI